jgi:hypothetical protein
MEALESFGSGVAGACALTLIHETVRRVVPDAPRMDVLGMRAIAKSMRAADAEPPAEDELHKLALAGDIVGNSLYYGLVGLGGREKAWLCGALLGLSAGVGAVLLPEPLGLGDDASARTPATKAMTIAWYLAGGLAAAATYRCLTASSSSERA